MTECRIPQFIRRIDGLRRIQTLRRACGGLLSPTRLAAPLIPINADGDS